MNQHLKKLYPNVKRILWTTNLVRGGDKIGDQPTAPAPHLDYHQNDEERSVTCQSSHIVSDYIHMKLLNFSNRCEMHD